MQRHAASVPVTVIGPGLIDPMRTSYGGRKSKGPRELLGTRPAQPLADAARQRADELNMTVSDYLAALIAADLEMPQYAPQPNDPSRVELPIPAA